MFSKIINSTTLDKLYENDEFCLKLGRVILLSNKLAEELLVLIKNEKIGTNTQKPPMAMLVKYIETKEFFPHIVPSLQQMDEGNVDQLLHSTIKKSLLDVVDDDFMALLVDLEEKINLVYMMIKEHNKISL